MKVVKTQIERDDDYLYYVGKDGHIHKAHKKTGKKSVVKRVGDEYKKEEGYLYYVDKDGDISRVKRK